MQIIFDTDASTDDAISLIYLLNNPDVTIKAITIAATGEAHGVPGAKNMADLTYMLGYSNIPIAYGSETSCDNSGKPFPDFIRQFSDELFKNIKVSEHPSPIITSSSISLMEKIINESNEKIVFLATGPLTNIAEFILAYSHLKNKIEKIVIMGGAVNVHGNIKALDPESDNLVAEWNIYADPKAAQIVFSSQIPVTLVPLDATNQVPMTKEFYECLSVQSQSGLKLIYQLLKTLIDDLGMETFLKEFYLWDPLAAMICIHPHLAITESKAIFMNLENAQTKSVEDSFQSSGTINVALNILHPENILTQLINEIKLNYLNASKHLTRQSIFQFVEEASPVPAVHKKIPLHSNT